MSEKLITLSEACELLSVSTWTLRRMVRAGDLEIIKLGSSQQSAARVRASDVERIMSRGVSQPELPDPANVPEYRPMSWR